MPAPPVPLQALLLQERVLRVDGARLEVTLWRDARGLRYRLECERAGTMLVRYDNDSPRGSLRTLAGRALPYAFRSVEQLRYDFERDLAAALK
jgi:hypothetical protein